MDPLLTKLFLCGLAIAVVLTLLEWLMMNRAAWRWRHAVEPRCRACGYIVCPRAKRICPECGGDLRAVGIIGDGPVRPAYPLGLILGGGVMLAAPAILAGWILNEWLPSFFSNYEATVSIDTGHPSNWPNDERDMIEITAYGHRYLSHQLPQSIGVGWWARAPDGPRWKVDAYQMTRGGWNLESRLPNQQSALIVPQFDRAAADSFVTFGGVDA